MKHKHASTKGSSFNLAAGLMAGLALQLGASAPARGDLLLSSTALTLKIVFLPSALAVGTTAATRATSTAATEKQALARVALEDAAHYFQSGELTGVLPSVLKQLRSESTELAKLEDAQLVDSLVEAAETFIDTVEKK